MDIIIAIYLLIFFSSNDIDLFPNPKFHNFRAIKLLGVINRSTTSTLDCNGIIKARFD